MTLPGISTSLLQSSIKSSPTSDFSTAFMAGIASTGPIDVATRVESFVDFKAVYGERISGYSDLYDHVDLFFQEGGSVAYIARAIGPSPVSAAVNLYDASGSTAPGDVSLVATAITPGDWANTYRVAVIAGDTGGEFKVTVDDGTTVVETSTSLVDRAAAVTWSAGSDYIRLTLGASAEDPRVQAAAAMSGGDDDHNGLTDATCQDALDLFLRGQGSGQVSFPGRTTKECHAQLAAHATANNRVAVGAFDNLTLAADLIADADDSRAEIAEDDLQRVFLCGSWLDINGVSTGTTRTVSPEGSILGLIAKSDAVGSNTVNDAAAGANGISEAVEAISQAEWSDADREALNDAGVNVYREVGNSIRLYGIRTMVDSSVEGAWTSFANARLAMAIQSLGEAIGESYVFQDIDGAGVVIGKFNGELTGMLLQLYNAGALYGDTTADAFLVDTGSAVNTTETLAAGLLKAKLYVKMSPNAEMISIDIIKVSITSTI